MTLAGVRTGGYPVLSFFFQAEDGIRDLTVTGVQTCALPIWSADPLLSQVERLPRRRSGWPVAPPATAVGRRTRPAGSRSGRPRRRWSTRAANRDRKSVV